MKTQLISLKQRKNYQNDSKNCKKTSEEVTLHIKPKNDLSKHFEANFHDFVL